MVPLDLPALQELELRVTVGSETWACRCKSKRGDRRDLSTDSTRAESKASQMALLVWEPHMTSWACSFVLVVTFPEMSAFKIPRVSSVGLCVGSFTIKPISPEVNGKGGWYRPRQSPRKWFQVTRQTFQGWLGGDKGSAQFRHCKNFYNFLHVEFLPFSIELTGSWGKSCFKQKNYPRSKDYCV